MVGISVDVVVGGSVGIAVVVGESVVVVVSNTSAGFSAGGVVETRTDLLERRCAG